MPILRNVAVSIFALLAAACATSPKIDTDQVTDATLNCDQVAMERQQLEKLEQEIEANRGTTTVNVFAFVLWLPGLAYTYYDADRAMDLINQRRLKLDTLC